MRGVETEWREAWWRHWGWETSFAGPGGNSANPEVRRSFLRGSWHLCTPSLNHPAYHWSTLWPLEVWFRGLYNSWWFCVHKLSMFIYLSMIWPGPNGLFAVICRAGCIESMSTEKHKELIKSKHFSS